MPTMGANAARWPWVHLPRWMPNRRKLRRMRKMPRFLIPVGGMEEKSAKADAQAALQGGLVRGKTAAFKEAIDFAQAVGIDENIISKAEAKLQEHKVVRERETIIEELPKF